MTDAPFSLKKIALPAFGPSVLYGISNGAILPVIALSARELNASVAVSSLVVAMVGIGSLISNVPAAIITTRYGERLSMVGAAAFGCLALLLCIFAAHVWMLALGVFLVGMGSSVFLLARQTFLIEAVPIGLRARALSTLAGSMRIGVFIGPFAGAALIHIMGLTGAYWIALVAMIGAGGIACIVPDLKLHPAHDAAHVQKSTIRQVGRDHAKIFLTLGLGVMLIGALRASRQVVIPLWTDHLGFSPAIVSIIYGLSASIDMAAFYPAGKVMDERGRMWVALPCVLVMGLALVAMPFTSSLISVLIVSLMIGLGNGIGSGIVMTLGADAAPRSGRNEFLGIWRMLADIGNSGGPVLLSAITALTSLAAGIATMGVLGLLAAAVLWKWLPNAPPELKQNKPGK